MTDTAQPRLTLASGIQMPQLGLGVWQTPAGETAAVVTAALEAGYLAVDTAAIYGNEEGVGAALAGRDDIFLTTKVWNSEQGFDETLRAFDASAGKLRRETIDLYLIHWPAPRLGRFVESWKALIRLKQEGRVRAIGVSNFDPVHLERIIDDTGELPDINQIELHPRFQQLERRAFHEQNRIATESWSPLGQGTLLADPVLAAIAARHGKTVAQVILRWHIDSGLVVIPKSVRADRLRENIDIFDFALSQEDMHDIALLDDADGRIGPEPATAAF